MTCLICLGVVVVYTRVDEQLELLSTQNLLDVLSPVEVFQRILRILLCDGVGEFEQVTQFLGDVHLLVLILTLDVLIDDGLEAIKERCRFVEH